MSDADELLKYKKLLDDGIITQEEFNIKKAELTGSVNATNLEADTKAKTGYAIGCFGLVAVVVAFVTYSAINGTNTDSGSGASDSFKAQYYAKERVKELLKSPSTAEFQDNVVHDLGGGAYQVTGRVDAQNSFGAKLRKTWTCKIVIKSREYTADCAILE